MQSKEEFKENFNAFAVVTNPLSKDRGLESPR